MAFLSIPNVRIAGIAAGVPKNVVSNLHPTEGDLTSSEYSPEEYVALTGVKERRESEVLTTSDLCWMAAERLIDDLKWDKAEIDCLIFVSQSPDYIQPATACILQHRLGLSKECVALDVSLGCSGWVYGLSVVGSICSSGCVRKALLLAGDAKYRVAQRKDPLFGGAGTVTAIEYSKDVENLQFHLGTNGGDYDAIITPDGGSRNQVSPKSFELENVNGKMIHRVQSRMKGMDVFSFGISVVPKSVRALAENFGFDYQNADYFVFHQANKKMNDTIVKKLKLDVAKVPSCMYEFGNTSSASIPLTIVTKLKNENINEMKKFLCCGFGVGLSWGTVAFTTEKLVISDLVEVDDSVSEGGWV